MKNKEEWLRFKQETGLDETSMDGAEYKREIGIAKPYLSSGSVHDQVNEMIRLYKRRTQWTISVENSGILWRAFAQAPQRGWAMRNVGAESFSRKRALKRVYKKIAKMEKLKELNLREGGEYIFDANLTKGLPE